MPRELGESVVLAPAVAPASSALFLHLVKAPTLEDKFAAMMLIWLALCYLQWILGPRRRRSGHWFVQYGAMAAYYLRTPLALYAAGTIYSSTSNNKVGISAACFSMILSSVHFKVIMTAYTLRDGPVTRWQPLLWLLYLVWLNWDFFWRLRKLGLSDTLYFVWLFIIPLLSLLLIKPALSMFDDGTISFARYMREHLNGCNYPFMQINGNWVTIRDLPQRQFAVGHRVIWLSYSFCRLLARRYFHLDCAEEGNAEVREFAFTDLLPDYKRAFYIVEVQLAFLHDCFFTSYHSSLKSSFQSAGQAITSVLKFSVSCGLLICVLHCIIFLKLDAFLVVRIAIIGFTAPIFLLIYTVVLPTHWHPVQNAFRYYPTDKVFSAHTERHIQRNQGSLWRNKMGQYSLIEDYDRRSFKKTFITWIKEHILSQVSPTFIEHHPVEEQEVSVPDSVRRLVAGTLCDINGPPTNGTRSLSMNSVSDDLSWTCRQKSHTHTILIWHIATWYCDMFAPEETRPSDNHEDATTLSGYYAYLVAFLPEFLPEAIIETQITLQTTLQEAQSLLGRKRMCMEEKHRRIRELELPEDENSLSTFQKGVRLGRQLEQLRTRRRWKVMAEFWAETILYIAPSDRVMEHFEQLAKGGEFVTHIWAMLSNAGILKRATEDWSPTQHEPIVSTLTV